MTSNPSTTMTEEKRVLFSGTRSKESLLIGVGEKVDFRDALQVQVVLGSLLVRFRKETMISGGSSYHHDLPHESQQYARLAKHHDWSTPENIPFRKFSKSQKKMNTPLTDLPFFYLFANNINAHTAAEQVSSLTLSPAIRGDIGNLWTLLLLCTCKFPEYHDKLVDVLGLCSEMLDVLPKKELLANPVEIYLPAAAPWIETLAVQMHY